MSQLIKRFVQEEDAPTAVEYAVMVALIIIVALLAITAVGTNVTAVFQAIADALTAAL
jgi:pilus assembly protein Flp/PilA